MNTSQTSIRDILYEPPGVKTKRMIQVFTVLSFIAVMLLIYVAVRQFYITGQLDARYWYFFAKPTTWIFLGEGLAGTLEAAVVAGFISFGLAFLMMLGRINNIRAFQAIARALIEFTRGVPTLLLVYFFFLVVPQYGITLAPLWRISLPVAISASGIVAEVLRSGINAVPNGQREAAMSLGMKESHTFLKVVFPQAFRYVIPSLIAELVIVVKDTTFAYVVNFPDLMQNAKVLISNYNAMLPVYLVVAVIYIIINYLLNKASVYAASRTDSTTNTAAS